MRRRTVRRASRSSRFWPVSGSREPMRIAVRRSGTSAGASTGDGPHLADPLSQPGQGGAEGPGQPGTRTGDAPPRAARPDHRFDVHHPCRGGSRMGVVDVTAPSERCARCGHSERFPQHFTGYALDCQSEYNRKNSHAFISPPDGKGAAEPAGKPASRRTLESAAYSEVPAGRFVPPPSERR